MQEIERSKREFDGERGTKERDKKILSRRGKRDQRREKEGERRWERERERKRDRTRERIGESKKDI